LNEKYPPASVTEQKQKAHDSAIKAIQALAAPNVAAGISFEQMEKALLDKNLREQGIKALSFSSNDQLLTMEIEFNRTAAGEPLLDKLKPNIQGKLILYVGLTTRVENGVIYVQILPGISRFEIDKVTIKDKYDVTDLGQVIVKFLDVYGDNLSGYISSVPALSVSAISQQSYNNDINIKENIKVDLGKVTATITAPDVKRSIDIKAIAPVLLDNGIILLAQFAVEGDTKVMEEESTGKVDSLSLEKTVSLILKDYFGQSSLPSNGWVLVRKDLIATTINTVFNQAQACILADSPIPKQDFNQTISIPSEKTIDCHSDRQCTSNRICTDIKKSQDNRNCKKCSNVPCPTLSKPLRTCNKCFNDPVCETAKATQNAIYEADYKAREFDCNRLRETEIATCKFEKASQKVLCESGREVLKQINRTGNFARIEGSIAGNANFNVCLDNIALNDELSVFKARLDFNGSVNIDANFKFIPLDIVGHLTCQVPWGDSERFNLSLPKQSNDLEIAMKLNTTTSSPSLDITAKPSRVKMKMHPSPTEYLITNKNFILSCAGAGLINPLVLGGSTVIPELRGEFDQEIPETKTSIVLPMSKMRIGDRELTSNVSDSGSALLFSATLQ